MNSSDRTRDRANLVERLRKVMAMSESDNPHVAAAALKTAARLMQEYGLTQEDVLLSDVQEKHARLPRKVPTDYDAQLIVTIAKAFNCEYFLEQYSHGKSEVVFVGVSPAAEIAAYSYDVLHRKLIAARRDYLAGVSRRFKAANRTRKANAFALGWALGVSRAARSLMAVYEVPGIVEQYMQGKELGATTSARSTASTHDQKTLDDMGRGWERGKKESLSAPLDGQAGTGPKLLH